MIRSRTVELVLGLCWLGCASALSPLQAEAPRYAENFSIERFETYSLLRVSRAWAGIGDAEQLYALVPREASIPNLPAGATLVRVPVQRLAVLATVYLGPVQALDLHDALVGIAHVDLVNDPIALDRVKRGLAKRIADGAAMDVESMLRLAPDLVMTSASGNAAFDAHPTLQRAGIPVAIMADYMENHPLARAEWIKFVAEFFGKQAEAQEYFAAMEARYLELVDLAAAVSSRPTVFSNAPYSGIWHVPGGRSYTARAFADAGADYLWSEDRGSGGRPVDIEVILKRAAEADFWLNPSHYDSIAKILAADERFVAFAALRHGRVYNNTKRVNKGGGNEIWERGVMRPDEVLADLIKVFHPELLPDHEFVYYEKLR